MHRHHSICGEECRMEGRGSEKGGRGHTRSGEPGAGMETGGKEEGRKREGRGKGKRQHKTTLYVGSRCTTAFCPLAP